MCLFYFNHRGAPRSHAFRGKHWPFNPNQSFRSPKQTNTMITKRSNVACLWICPIFCLGIMKCYPDRRNYIRASGYNSKSVLRAADARLLKSCCPGNRDEIYLPTPNAPLGRLVRLKRGNLGDVPSKTLESLRGSEFTGLIWGH